MESMEEKKEWVDWVEAKILQKTTIIDEAGNYLIITRTTEGFGARKGKDDLSGGSIDKKDFKQHFHLEAIGREVLEETGLTGLDFKIVYVDSGTKMTKSVGEIGVLVLGYRCNVSGVKPQVKLSSEHTNSRWVSKEEALNADFGDDGGLHRSIVEGS